jgi:Uri superfamily endonuclease
MTGNSLTAKGTYLLLLRLERDTKLAVGRLGSFLFPTGWYAYPGSALGPGGLAARLARHQRQSKRLHWHIDYLLAHGTLMSIWQVEYPDRLECTWAAAIQQWDDTRTPVTGFGSSDCHCPTHLFHWPDQPSRQRITNALATALPGNLSLRNIPHVGVDPPLQP